LKDSVDTRKDYECKTVLQQLNATNLGSRLMQPSEYTSTCKERGFDVVVNTLSPGWINARAYPTQWESIMNNLNETIRVSFDLLDAETVVLQTIPIMNNLHKLSDVQKLNKFIWNLAEEFNQVNQMEPAYFHDGNKKKKQILVMDMYAFNVYLFLENLIHIGLISREYGDVIKQNLSMASNHEEFIDISLALDHLMNNTTNKCFDRRKRLCQKVGHVCFDSNCTIPSAITADGLHYCTGITGGRVNAALACLLQCRYSNKESDADFLNICMLECNKKFLTIEPVQWATSGNVSVHWRYTDSIGTKNFTESIVTNTI
jgi:hypothetical protein